MTERTRRRMSASSSVGQRNQRASGDVDEALTRSFAVKSVAAAFHELDAGRRDVLKLVVAP